MNASRPGGFFGVAKDRGYGYMQGLSGPIAQLDRVPDYESGGRGFESSSVRHLPLQNIDFIAISAHFVELPFVGSSIFEPFSFCLSLAKP